MAVWARSERTFAIDAGGWGGFLKRPYFFWLTAPGWRSRYCVLGTPTLPNSR